MKRLTLTASLVLAVALPGAADARLSHTQKHAYYHAYAHVVQMLGLHAAGCKLMGADRTCHERATDQRVLTSTDAAAESVVSRPSQLRIRSAALRSWSFESVV